MSSDSAALICARGWIGTPYVLGAALRGAGCDCIGLLRGVWSDLTGQPAPPVPAWRPDWVNARGRPLVQAARSYLDPIPTSDITPGDAVVLRVAGTREAHCGVVETGDRFIHAQEGVGVVCVPFASYRAQVAFAARFPAS